MENKIQYVACISYGKDSLYMLEVIKKHNMPLDRIVTVEIMATKDMHADLPPMVEFKEKADKIILDRYGIEVEHLHAEKSYEEYFYYTHTKAGNKHLGEIYGFPYRMGAWCNSRLKQSILSRFKNPKKFVQYVGIAAEETSRHHSLHGNIISPLVEHNVTERECRTGCEELGLLSPIYTTSARGGCWFCHNQSLEQLRLLRKNYPERWEKLLNWDNDSINSFRQDGTTVHDLEKRFALEDAQMTIFNFIEE